MSVTSRSPSQNKNVFELFLSNFEQLLNDANKCQTSLSVITGDFSARSASWWVNDINTTEASKLYSFTSASKFSQLMNEPTHIQTNSSLCIDLIFTDQPNLSVVTRVHAFLHSLLHPHPHPHQINA